MEFHENVPPRRFSAGNGVTRELLDCGTLRLDPSEQVTLLTATSLEYDVVRKEWGYYATPSLNGRLADNDLRGVLAKNRSGKFYVLLVEKGHESEFVQYLTEEEMSVVAWMDSNRSLAELERGVEAVRRLP